MKQHHENMGLTQGEVDEATEEQIQNMAKEIDALHRGIDSALADLIPLQSQITPSVLTIRNAVNKLENLSHRM